MPQRSPPAASGEIEHWREPILFEETRRKLEKFRNQGYIPPNHKSGTLRNIAKLERYWHKYCSHLQVNYKDHLTSEDPAVYMSFFDWMWELTVKSADKTKRLQSYDGYWRALNQYFTLFTLRPMSNHVLEQIRRFLNHKFPAERGISRRAKVKLTLSVEEYGLFQRHWWKHSTCFVSGNMIVQQSLSMLLCSITGTRPAVLFPESETNTDVDGDGEEIISSRKKKCRTDQPFVSDVPQYVSGDDMPRTICYEDIDLFYLKNPENNRDMLCAVVNFRNFKGRPEGEDGTKFFMHCDYLLQYCPILHIVALALRDNAFENPLTPELVWKLKAPSRLPSLQLKWKKDKLKLSVLRRMCKTANDMVVHEQQAMTYNHSRMALQDIGKGLGYQDDLTHYCFRRWAANAINKKYVQSERMRILGQSGNAVFEKHYQTNFITDLQEVALARPSQALLCKEEARKIRNRDPLAPKDLNDEQLAAISRDSRLLDLKSERKRLRIEICMLAGSIKAAKLSHPELYKKHNEICRQQQRMRKKLKLETRRSLRNEYFESMPVAEVDKQINQLLHGPGTASMTESEEEPEENEESWEPPTPTYFFEERARIVKTFYGTDDAETLDPQIALERRIQVTKDLVSLCHLSEPNRRGRKFNWDREEINSDADFNEDVKIQDDSCNTEHDKKCSTEICIVCARKFPRIDSLRRHLITQHLSYVRDGSSISCTRLTCKNGPEYDDVLLFLNHAAAFHEYDLNITMQHLDQFTRQGSPPRELNPVVSGYLSNNGEEWHSETTTLVSSPQSSIGNDVVTSCPMQIARTRCIFCTCSGADDKLEFESIVMAQEYVKHKHLKVFEEDDLIRCPDFYCRSYGIVLFGHMAFQNHVITVHGENSSRV